MLNHILQGGWRQATADYPSVSDTHQVAAFMGFHSAWKDIIDNPVAQEKLSAAYKNQADVNIPNAIQVFVNYRRLPE